MRYRPIIRLLGILASSMAIAFLGCIAVDWLLFEHNALSSWRPVFIEIGVIIISCLIFGKKATLPFLHKEAIATIGIAWIFAIYIASLPYRHVLQLEFVDSLLEATSGLTTTGATVFSNVEILPKSILFWRSLSQWLGGLGIVVLFVALISSLGVSGKALFSAESTLKPSIKELNYIQKSASKTIQVYLGFSALITVLLMWAGVDLFNALCHMGTSISTGGFSNFNASLGYYNDQPIVQWILVGSMIIGSSSFSLLGYLAYGHWEKIRVNEEWWTYLALLVSAGLLIAMLLSATQVGQLNEFTIRQSLIQAVSFISGTGYSSTNYQLWPGSVQMILFLLIVIGGCSNSTSGGLKVVRIITIGKTLLAVLKRTINPQLLKPLRLNGVQLEPAMRDSMILYAVLCFFLWGIGLAMMAVFEPFLSISGSLSALLSSWANAGVSFAELSPSGSFSDLTAPAKILLSFSMLLGRLEAYTLLALFMPSLWKKFG